MTAQDKKVIEMASATIAAQHKNLQILLAVLQTAFDEHTDGWEDTEKGQEAPEDLDNLDAAIDDVETAVNILNNLL